jgi:hypothetical protein
MLYLMMPPESLPEPPPGILHSNLGGFRAIPGACRFCPDILAGASRCRLCPQADGFLDEALFAYAQLAGYALQNVDRSFVDSSREYSVHRSSLVT